MSTAAPTAIAAKNQRCQPSASARRLNAAPALNVRIRLKKLVYGTLLAGMERRHHRRLGRVVGDDDAALTQSQRKPRRRKALV